MKLYVTLKRQPYIICIMGVTKAIDLINIKLKQITINLSKNIEI